MTDPDRTGPYQVGVAKASCDDGGDVPEGIVTVGRYSVEKVLGEGGFGKVYLAHDSELQRRVAIKVSHPRFAAQAATYVAEARTAASLDHPGILPVYDIGATDRFPCFFVSKFIDGTDLASRIRAAPMSFREAAEVVMAVADALHYAHRRGIVHRDVKPGNILIDRDGRYYLADFGLALREDDDGRGTRYAGTPAYMSPEQARGDGHLVDGRSDVFSLGAVLYELLTGRQPFRADTPVEVRDRVATCPPRPPRQIDDLIPKDLEHICLKALAKSLMERYTTAKDLADDLRQWVSTAGGHGAANGLIAEPKADGPVTIETRKQSEHDDLDRLLLIPLLVVMFLGAAIPGVLAYCVAASAGASEATAKITGLVTGWVAFLVRSLPLVFLSFRSVTIGPDGLTFTRNTGASRFVPWHDFTGVRKASRSEVLLWVWAFPGFPPRGAMARCSTLNHFLVEWRGGYCYFYPEEPDRFPRVIGEFRRRQPPARETSAVREGATTGDQ